MLYAAVALVLTGIAHWDTLNNDAPVANALKALGYNRLRLVVTIGALLGMISSLLVFQYGQARIWFAMSRDRLLPGMFSRIHPQFQTPHVSTWIAGFLVGIPAGIWDIGTLRRSDQHRHAVRLHRGIGRGDHPAARAAGPPAELPRAMGSVSAGLVDRLLPGADAEPAA
jgi:hypothetical protein